MAGGYVFWLVMARITTPEIIGTSSAVISLATIFTTIVAMGIPSGLPKLLGKYFVEKSLEEAKVFVKSSFILVTIAIIICSGAILIAQNFIYDIFKMDSKLVTLLILFMIATTTTQLLRSIITSTLRTKIFPISMSLAVSIKLGLSIVLILVGMGVLGVVFGYLFFEITISALSAATIFLIFRKSAKSEINLISTSRQIFKVSVVSWIPGLIYNMGSQLGTLIVLGTYGAGQAGIFFVAYSIFAAISGIMSSLITISFPVLSSMTDGRKTFAWKITKMSLILSVPFSASLIFYSQDIMGLFGNGFIIGSSTLEILLFSVVPTGIWGGVNNLMYAFGKYRDVLYLGLATNVSRTVLYFVLVPTYGSEGAALSFSIGAIAGLVVAILNARSVKFLIFWKDILFLFFIPLAISFVLYYLGIHFVIGIVITLVASYMIFLKMGVINRIDLRDSLESLPSNVSNSVLKVFDTITKKVGRS